MEATKPQPKVNSRWHKTPNRMSDPAYLALPLIARAALAAFDELCAFGPVVGTRSRLCVIIGAEPKHARLALDPLRDGGFIAVEETDGQWIVNTPSTTVQHIANTSPTPRQRPSNGKQKSANDAGLADHSLKEIEIEKEIKIENNPLSPPEGAAQPTDAIVHWVPTADGKPYPITAAKVAEWQAAFPTVSVEAEIPSAIQWARDNPTRAPKYGGATRYIGNWLRRGTGNQSQLSIGGLGNGTTGRPQRTGQPLGAGMGRHRTSQPGSIYDLEL